MSALEKSAWSELVVVLLAAVAVAVFLPWMGHRASDWFGLLGLLPVGMYFLRKRGGRIIVDERDREIQRWSTSFGVNTAWMGTFLALIAIVLWYGGEDAAVPKWYLNWIIWLGFAVCYGARAAATIFAYRGQPRAA